MKILAQIILFLGILSLLGGLNVSANQSLQAKIDATREGGTLKIKKGIYHETVILDKPITFEGESGVIFKVHSAKPAIKITGKNITIKGIKIESFRKTKNASAIYINGNNHRVENITIDSENIGIKVENANHTNFHNIKITGFGKGNGFDLWQSTHNTFSKIVLDHVQDGFYLENSNSNSFIQNRINDSRYGIHVMFSNYITIKNNVSTRNYSGAMVMGTWKSVIEHNYFTDNNQNVNSQGLLVYDVHESTIKNNYISQNRVGLYMDNASGNSIQHNKFVSNFVGAQLSNFKNNFLNNNSFIGNVNEIQANDGSNNHIQRNYWDAAMTLDTNGDGISELPYKIDPYFLNITSETPPYQMFFQNPGMLLLQKMLKSPNHLIVTDKEPLMNNALKTYDRTESQQTNSWIMSLLMIFCSLFIIYLGRKKR
jgi:nitrous oxidase accessory protein